MCCSSTLNFRSRQSDAVLDLTVNYRLILAPDTLPGTYDWPLKMVVRRPVAGDFAPARAARRPFTLGANG